MTENKPLQPDWHAIAEKFDMWLPQLAPAGEAMLDALDIRDGDLVLDVGVGTGEPALTLARRTGGVKITGVDQAAGMVQVAAIKAKKEGLAHIDFHVMAAEALTFTDNRFDIVLSRFGVMLFENPLLGLRQMFRVLKPGGRLAITVWSTAETMLTLLWFHRVLEKRLPQQLLPPLDIITSLGSPGAIAELLEQAGFNQIQVENRRLDYQFSSFENYWQVLEASDLMKKQFDALPPEQRHQVRDEVALLAASHVGLNGFVVPHEYILACAVKPA